MLRDHLRKPVDQLVNLPPDEQEEYAARLVLDRSSQCLRYIDQLTVWLTSRCGPSVRCFGRWQV